MANAIVFPFVGEGFREKHCVAVFTSPVTDSYGCLSKLNIETLEIETHPKNIAQIYIQNSFIFC